MRLPALVLLTLALGWGGSSLLAQQGSWLDELGQVEEPRSEVRFSEYRSFPGGEEKQLLIGTGLYTKTFLAIKIYAFGFYVEPEGAAAAMSSWDGVPASKRRKDEDFYRDLWSGDFAKSVRWILRRDVDGDDVAEAFDDVLGPRLKRLTKRKSAQVKADTQRALASFRGYFDAELSKGMEATFSWYPGGRLVTSIDGEVVGTLESEALCLALFACYLDDDPLDEDAKEGFAESVERVCNAGQTEADQRAAEAAAGAR